MGELKLLDIFLKATRNDKYRQIDSSTIDGNVEILHSVQLYRSSWAKRWFCKLRIFIPILYCVYSSLWNLSLTWRYNCKAQRNPGISKEGFTWNFGERWEFRPEWAGQPEQKRELVDSDLLNQKKDFDWEFWYHFYYNKVLFCVNRLILELMWKVEAICLKTA